MLALSFTLVVIVFGTAAPARLVVRVVDTLPKRGGPAWRDRMAAWLSRDSPDEPGI
jgi:hypothetical protein